MKPTKDPWDKIIKMSVVTHFFCKEKTCNTSLALDLSKNSLEEYGWFLDYNAKKEWCLCPKHNPQIMTSTLAKRLYLRKEMVN